MRELKIVVVVVAFGKKERKKERKKDLGKDP